MSATLAPSPSIGLGAKPRRRHGLARWMIVAAVLALTAIAPASATPAATPVSTSPGEPGRVPVLAYYYIWFEPSSWDRAKTDYPLLGRYSSDDRAVMQQHVKWAKDAGIDGFIVSWKNTDVLSRRLELLVEVAKEEGFKLAIICQGLDVRRQPRPVEAIAADLDYFLARYADHEVFDLFDRPVVIWSGTWEFSRDEIAAVTGTRRDRLSILASERSPGAYEHVADLFDGDAYYWSSVNPETFPGYPEKLAAMATAVHTHGGLWIAPAAPGFDARLVGGERVVERLGGATLRREMGAALASSPDAVGLISWNEFSENSHIEPSCDEGSQTLEVLAELRGGVAPIDVGVCAVLMPSATPIVPASGTDEVGDVTALSDADAAGATPVTRDDQRRSDDDSSSPAGNVARPYRLLVLAALIGVALLSLTITAQRARHSPSGSPVTPGSEEANHDESPGVGGQAAQRG